jgi:hypothetical protein
MPEQLGLTYATGGQSTVALHIVVSEVDGFEEDGEARQNADGTHSSDITYSRRATKTLTLELAHTASPTAYMAGGHVDATYNAGGVAAWEIRSVQRINTRGPVQLQLELVSLTESIAAPA